MHPTILIIGGCRSGKSSQALAIASKFKGSRKLFVATCIANDEEMRQRVRRHQEERGPAWETFEEPTELVHAIKHHGPGYDLMLVDCLTLWVSNLMARDYDDNAFWKTIENLAQIIVKPPCPLIFVTNDVGAGIVPENALARKFRDFNGWVNQHVAAACSRVVWMVAGIPVLIKPQEDGFDSRQA
jgi:adenosylcobinamide kinase/adenosylcobinamide-phosphate guanylyltransferase